MTIQPDPARARADAPADASAHAGQHERAELIAQAHQRSESYGLRPYESPDFCPVLQSELKTRIERSQSLFTYALPVMETLHDQIVDTQSMIILTDADGLILHAMGDDDFLARADKISLRPGSEWSEARRGTNAIGTALAENRATLIHGADHYLEANQFLTCSCMPILDPYGKTVGALDVTGDQRGFHKHTMALVRMSAQMIENQLFGNAFRDMVCIRFHSRAEFLGTLVEGIVSFTPGGRFLSANRSGQFQLGLSIGALQAHTFSSLFGLSMSQLSDAARAAHAGIVPLHLPSGVKVSARVEWKTPAAALPGGTEARHAGTGASGMPRSLAAGPAPSPGLDELDTGDAQIRTVIGKLRKVIGKDIPVMVLGETGTGKELMARAIHADSGRRAGPFIAVNCASIPENLIESELFGYEEGAFTGARKKGGIGKMLLANGGTLFLDEIGDMPLHLQGRLLRALQERAVSPLGSSKVIHIDVSVVCATNRNLRDLVASGQFREDLYYRLNGLVVRLPALRERSDLDVVAGKLLRQDHGSGGGADAPRISDAVMALFRRYHWPGNIRQLGNLLRTARLMAEGEAEITEEHLPDDFLDDLREAQAQAPVPAAAPAVAMAQGLQPTRLAEVEAMAIVATVKAHNGNISAAAKALGISRNTVYRKMEEARGLPQ